MNEVPMKISYDLKFPDLLEMNVHIGSGVLKKNSKIIVALLLSLSLVTFLMVLVPIRFYLEDNRIIFLFIFLVVPMIFLYFAVRSVFPGKKNNHEAFRETLEGKNFATYFGRNEIELDPEWVKRRNEYRYEKVRWIGIRRIEETDRYIFILDTDMSAFIIPKRAFSSKKEKKKFLDKAREYFEASR